MPFLETYDNSTLDDAGKVGLVDGWIGTDTAEFFAELRRERPIFVTPGPVVVTRYADVQEVLSRPTVFSVRPYVAKMDPTVGPFMLARDATTINERDKSIMLAMMPQEELPRVRDLIGLLCDRAIDEGLDGGRLELVTQLSRKIPVQLCGEYFGFPGPDVETMMHWSRSANLDMFFNPGDEDVHAAAVESGTQVRAYVRELIATRRAAGVDGDEDILARLLRTSLPETLGFDDERIISNIVFMLIGGVETVSGAVIKAIDELLRRPEQLAAAQQAARDGDRATVAAHVWEALRLNPSFPYLLRYCETDYTLASASEHATTIKAGTYVYTSVWSAMQDAGEVPEPGEFRLGRPRHHLNLHFGYGHHLCLCYYLGLLETEEIIARLFARGPLRRAEGADGQLDTQGGPYPERLVVEIGT